MAKTTVVFDDPNVLADRVQMQARAEADTAVRDALLARVPQVKALYPKLVAGTATNREVQGALAFVLRWLSVQESD